MQAGVARAAADPHCWAAGEHQYSGIENENKIMRNYVRKSEMSCLKTAAKLQIAHFSTRSKPSASETELDSEHKLRNLFWRFFDRACI